MSTNDFEEIIRDIVERTEEEHIGTISHPVSSPASQLVRDEAENHRSVGNGPSNFRSYPPGTITDLRLLRGVDWTTVGELDTFAYCKHDDAATYYKIANKDYIMESVKYLIDNNEIGLKDLTDLFNYLSSKKNPKLINH